MKLLWLCCFILGAGVLGGVLAFTLEETGWRFWVILALYIAAFYFGLLM